MTASPLVVIATVWGPRHGGINAFNADLCRALAKRLRGCRPVVCVIAGPDDAAARQEAEKAGVRLIATGREKLDSGNVVVGLRDAGIEEVAWWIGHDVTTGGAALDARELMRCGQVALIHHMAYRHYAGYKHRRGIDAVNRHEEQAKLFRQADRCFAVGLVLRDNLLDMLDDLDSQKQKPVMLVPGLAEDVNPRQSRAPFRAIVFGRLDKDDDRIKQGRLAIAAMAEARAQALATPDSAPLLRGQRPVIDVVGIDQPGGETEQELRILCERRGGSGPPLLTAQPFMEDRAALFRQLAGAHVALMPSWHEGFGLTGWEAVAAGVPLIASMDSGLYHLLKEETPGLETGCLYPIRVGGHTPTDDQDDNRENFTEADVGTLRDAIRIVAAEHERHRRNAETLRTTLRAKGMTWDGTTATLLDALGLNDPPADTSVPASPQSLPPPQASPSSAAPPPQPGSAGTGTLPVDRRQALPTDRAVPESLLLRPEYQVVPFQNFLEPAVTDILAWALDATQSRPAVALRLYVGNGGSGKTRLMVETCGRLLDRPEKDWTAGLIPDGRRPEALAKEVAALVRDHPRVFLVMDYAETRRREVRAVVRAALVLCP